jgi:RNA polymerase sigma-70 factor (ECF subfamily)
MPEELLQNATEGPSEEQVVGRILAGETPLYEVIMRRYNKRLYRVARSIVKSDAEAEDVVQDAYVRAFQHLRQYEARAKFSTWLTRIAVYEALRRVRRTRQFEEWDAMKESEQNETLGNQSSGSPESLAASAELARLLEEAIEDLPDGYREVVMMRDVEGMSTAETAECLSISEDNAKVRLHRGHALLRKTLFQNAKLTAAELFPFHAVRCDRIVLNVLSRLESLK